MIEAAMQSEGEYEALNGHHSIWTRSAALEEAIPLRSREGSRRSSTERLQDEDEMTEVDQYPRHPLYLSAAAAKAASNDLSPLSSPALNGDFYHLGRASSSARGLPIPVDVVFDADLEDDGEARTAHGRDEGVELRLSSSSRGSGRKENIGDKAGIILVSLPSMMVADSELLTAVCRAFTTSQSYCPSSSSQVYLQRSCTLRCNSRRGCGCPPWSWTYGCWSRCWSGSRCCCCRSCWKRPCWWGH